MNIKTNKNLSLFSKHYFFWGFSPENVILVIFFGQALNSYTLAGVIFMLRHLLIAFFELPTGVISDYIGRRKSLIISSIFYILLKISYLLACFYNPMLFLAISSICYGIAESFISGTNGALLYETLETDNKEKEFHSYYGKFKAYHTIALAVSGLLGGFIASFFSFEYIMVLSLIGSVLFLLTNVRLYDLLEHKVDTGHIKHTVNACYNIVSNKKLLWVAISSVVGSGGNRAVREYMPSYLESLIPYWAMGIFRFLNWTFTSISSWYSDFFTKMWGLVRSYKIFSVMGPFSILFALLVNNILTPFIILFEYFAHGASHAIGSEIKQKEFTKNQRATMDSIISMFGNISEGLVSLLVGFMAQMFTPYYAMFIALAFRLIALPALFKAFRNNKNI